MATKNVVTVDFKVTGEGARQLAGLSQKLRALADDANAPTRGFKQFEDSVEDAADATRRLGGAVEDTGKKTRTLRDVFVGTFAGNLVADFFREATRAAIDFGRESVKAAADASDATLLLRSAAVETGQQFTTLQAQAKAFAAEFAVSVRDAERLFGQASIGLEGTGIDANTFLRRAADLAAARGIGASQLPTIITQIFNGADEGLGRLFAGKNPSTFFNEFARAAGRSAESLTDLERRQILANAVVEKGAELFGRSADRLRTTAGQLDSFSAGVADAEAAVGKLIVRNELFITSLEALQRATKTGIGEDARDGFEEFGKAVVFTAQAAALAAGAFATFVNAVKTAIDAIRLTAEGFIGLGEVIGSALALGIADGLAGLADIGGETLLRMFGLDLEGVAAFRQKASDRLGQAVADLAGLPERANRELLGDAERFQTIFAATEQAIVLAGKLDDFRADTSATEAAAADREGLAKKTADALAAQTKATEEAAKAQERLDRMAGNVNREVAARREESAVKSTTKAYEAYTKTINEAAEASAKLADRRLDSVERLADIEQKQAALARARSGLGSTGDPSSEIRSAFSLYGGVANTANQVLASLGTFATVLDPVQLANITADQREADERLLRRLASYSPEEILRAGFGQAYAELLGRAGTDARLAELDVIKDQTSASRELTEAINAVRSLGANLTGRGVSPERALLVLEELNKTLKDNPLLGTVQLQALPGTQIVDVAPAGGQTP
jgi:hypothetical protein